MKPKIASPKKASPNYYPFVERLLELVWSGDDLMDQETLFDLQEKMTDFALKVAKNEGKVEDLKKAFPYLYA